MKPNYKTSDFKIDFQLFADGMTDEDKELLAYFGLDENGNQLDNTEDNPVSVPPVINEETTVTPEETIPDNLPVSDSDTHNTAEETPLPTDSGIETPVEESLQEEGAPLILGRFRNQAELERAFLEQQNFLGKQSNEIGELRSRLNKPPAVEKTGDNGDLFAGISDSEMMDGFMKNPKQFLKGVLDITMSEQMAKVRTQMERESEQQKYLEKYFSPDGELADMREDFLQVYEEVGNPEYALNIVRGRKWESPEKFFSDKNYVGTQIDSDGVKALLSDVSTADKLGEKVKQKIIDDYLKKIKESKSNVTLITNDSGSAPKTPPKKYDNFHDMADDSVSLLKEMMKK